MKITYDVLGKLSEAACQNRRLCANIDLRTDEHDCTQRMLNALEPGTVIPIYRHRDTAETMIMIRGRLKELLYDSDGNLTDCFEMSATGECSILQIEKRQWHSLECLEPGTVIFEAKDGAYVPLSEVDIFKSNK